MKHVTLMKLDYRRKMPVHVYCVKCDWTVDLKDSVEGYRIAKEHDGKATPAKPAE